MQLWHVLVFFDSLNVKKKHVTQIIYLWLWQLPRARILATRLGLSQAMNIALVSSSYPS